MTTAKIEIPPKLIPVFAPPRGSVRYRGAYGGRGSAKTRTFALMSAIWAYQMGKSGESGVILCCREHLNSLDESSMEEVKQAIRSVDWLAAYFDIGEKYIRTIDGRIKYVFAGLRHNLDSIKSKARILLCWLDEAEPVSEQAYIKLIPTVREDNSEIWLTWNPELDGSPTDQRYRKTDRDDAIIVEINYQDNPWFPDVLEQERQSDRESLDDATYAHIWEGAYLESSEAQVLYGKWRITEFDIPFATDPMYGLDWGFANDPTVAVECYVDANILMIRREAGMVGLELDDTGNFMKAKIPGIDGHVIRADSARPESISHVQRKGLPRLCSVKKWPDSVKDGIQHIRSYKEIWIYPDCVETIKEARLYSYKRHKQTGDILPEIVDAHNHYWDAIRYALAPLISGGSGMALGNRRKRR